MQEENSSSLSDNGVEKKETGKIAKKNGQRVGYYYIITKSLKESRKNDVMRCFYIKGLFNIGACVIKEGCHGESKDSYGRDIKDRLLWQKELHQQLQDKVRIPRYIDSFEENGNYYLVIERIKGSSLSQLLKRDKGQLREAILNRSKTGKKFLDYLLRIIDLLEKLHNEQVVHRDATANNFMIMPGGKLALIDMELSYSISRQQPQHPYQLGTHGYMSPQQLQTLQPTKQEDIFALGAIIAQIWTCISPSKMNDTSFEDLQKRLHFFIPDRSLADVAIKCMHPQPGERPSLQVIRNTIRQYKNTSKASNRETSPSYHYDPKQIHNIIQDVINTLSTALLADPEQGWFTESKKGPDIADKKQINKSWYASFTRGAAGVILLLSRAKRMGFDIDKNLPFIEKGIELIYNKYILIDHPSSSLYTGAAGIAASLTEANNNITFDNDLKAKINKLLSTDSNLQLNIANGISGIGIGAIMCSSLRDNQELDKQLSEYLNQVLSEQQKDGSWLFNGQKNKKKAIPGFTKGIAGITYFLLCVYEHSGNKAALNGAEKGLQWLMRKAIREKEAYTWRSSTGKELSAFLEHGPVGIAMAFIKGYEVTGISDYKHYATGALLSQPGQIVNGNLSHSNGLAGLGEVYLEAHQILGDNIWWQRADWIAQHILHLKNIHPLHGAYWITQHERQPFATFGAGLGGVLHFLIRYLHPEKVSFPMLPRKEVNLTASRIRSIHSYSK
ncbi:lanthionine synthetase LanC family protein [Chitinophaga rhizophila]|uniref:non-specific serine/threonine protein kinase n=1 Tax=Chitinophaga rhizophila TaxID=2866212 RepID=A0ABS7GF75_9BACT|nr:lanthionine synthetase LanC family protein [Chitinophaga rhizophila]MBW8686334.1 protein kinase [Chitinophaga rhizophila]